MVCTANDLLEWKDFPKGLRILLLDEDKDSSSEIKSKLLQMEYIVTTFFSEYEALSSVERKTESFHVAIVEINAENTDGRYRFLETAKDLPTIMMSKENCLSTMMKCIALGAVEFLIKPLSEDKLRNIWQHVVHKAFNTSGSENSESLKSVKDFVGSVLKLQHGPSSDNPKNDDTEMDDENNDCAQSAVVDKFPAPSTPQIKQGRSLDDGDYHHDNQPNNSETKFDDNTCDDSSIAKMEVDVPPQVTSVGVIKVEEDCSDGSKSSDKDVAPASTTAAAADTRECTDSVNKASAVVKNSSRQKSNKKKMKVDWTSELHKKFVQAVEQLGVDQAIPSRILELMKVEGLTRHNVASHLQKYRMSRRHILPKEDERRWPQPRDSRNYYSHSHNHRPAMMAYSPYQTNHGFMPGQVYPVWGQQGGGRPPGPPMWGPPPGYPPWQPVESWHWKPYPGMHADAWGCPVIPPPHPCPSTSYPPVQPGYRFPSPDNYVKHSVDSQIPGDEVIDKVVKEAISKPWLPLPIGLKPPSTDSVLAELSRQGISTVPPHHINNYHQSRTSYQT